MSKSKTEFVKFTILNQSMWFPSLDGKSLGSKGHMHTKMKIIFRCWNYNKYFPEQ